MHLLHRYAALATVSVAISSLIAGCGESKVAQCNKFIEEVKDGEPIVTKFEEESKKVSQGFQEAKNLNDVKEKAVQSAELMNQFADDVDEIVKEIKTLELKDEKLVGFQKRYAQSGEEVSQGIREMGKALGEMGKIDGTPASLETIKTISSTIGSVSKKLASAGQESNQVISEINSYCGSK